MDLTTWLEQTESKRNELYDYGRSPLPCDIGERHNDIERAIQNSDDAKRLQSEAESYLTQARAQALFAVLHEYPDLSAKDREIVIKDRVRDLQRLVDGLTTTSRTIRDRIYSTLNANRSHA